MAAQIASAAHQNQVDSAPPAPDLGGHRYLLRLHAATEWGCDEPNMALSGPKDSDAGLILP